ncbi:hypothetical protein U1Q18_020870, partial [Sarracenia purpurea var. burkii]
HPVAPQRDFSQSSRLIYTQIDESEVPGRLMLSSQLQSSNGRSSLATIGKALPKSLYSFL